MSNKRIRIKNAKHKKKLILRDQSFETVDLIIKLNNCTDNLRFISYRIALNNIRMKHIEQIRQINEIIKYGKVIRKGERIVRI